MSISLQVNQLFDQYRTRMVDVAIRRTALSLTSKLISRTPVGNPSLWQHPPPKGYVGGRARGNWQVSRGSPASGETGRIDPSGNATMGRATEQILQAVPGDSIYITNNVPYIGRLAEGWSSQAASGWIDVAILEVQAELGAIR